MRVSDRRPLFREEMKKNTRKRDFTKFTKRNTHKRRDKEARKDALLSLLDGIGVEYEGVRLGDSFDGGRRARKSGRTGKDEIKCEGIFSGSRGGFGFVTLEDREEDIFIPEDKCGGAIDGDYVELIYHEYKSYTGERKTEGRITRVIKYGREFIIGNLKYEDTGRRYQRAKRRVVLVPDEARIPLLPVIVDMGGAEVGDKVAVKIMRGTGTKGSPNATVIRVLGVPGSKEASYEAILLESGMPLEFTEEELLAAEAAARMPIDYDSREDHRKDVIFTIDGEGAKDLDDAISLCKTSHGWLLGVHIADVSRYVEEKTVLDRTAMARGTSVYFTDKVVPMLPPALSNGACSLNSGEDKCALSAFITLDKEGNIDGVRIVPTVIKSRVRGVYSEVNRIFDGSADKELLRKYKSVIPSLTRMRELYELLSEKAKRRGMLELELPEAVILLDEDGKPDDILAAERGIGERLIEQFMLTANEAVATELIKTETPCVYRVHELPPVDKMRDFLRLAHDLGLDIRGIDPEKPDPCKLSAILKDAEELGVERAVSYILLRSMSKAKYSDVHGIHYGLAISNYCHFTSPIRRLSDLATHRIIHKVLIDGKRREGYKSYAKRAAIAATESELRAVSAERRIDDLYKTLYMSERIGEEYDAHISSVTSFGIFAELDNTCEGLIPIEEMPGYFTFDERTFSMHSRDMVYKIGDKIRIKVVEADLNRCKLKFALVL